MARTLTKRKLTACQWKSKDMQQIKRAVERFGLEGVHLALDLVEQGYTPEEAMPLLMPYAIDRAKVRGREAR